MTENCTALCGNQIRELLVSKIWVGFFFFKKQKLILEFSFEFNIEVDPCKSPTQISALKTNVSW